MVSDEMVELVLDGWFGADWRESYNETLKAELRRDMHAALEAAGIPACEGAAEVPEELRRLSEAATGGQWQIHIEPVGDPAGARLALSAIVDGTPTFVPSVVMLTTDAGLAPAITGCGQTSGANAEFIASLVNWFRSLLASSPAQKEGER